MIVIQNYNYNKMITVSIYKHSKPEFDVKLKKLKL